MQSHRKLNSANLSWMCEKGYRHVFKVAVTLQANTHTHTCTVCSYSFICLPQYGTVMHVTLVDGVKQTLVTLLFIIDVYPTSYVASGPLMFLSGPVLHVASLKTAMQKRLRSPTNTAYNNLNPHLLLRVRERRREERGRDRRSERKEGRDRQSAKEGKS